MSDSCVFCLIPKERVVAANDLAYAILDGFPVTPLHALVIPRRHAPSYFELTPEELLACNDLLLRLRRDFTERDAAIAGFNIGVNSGEAAGQTIFHCHIHLIPRRAGDVENPRGGVRHVIPGKGFY